MTEAEAKAKWCPLMKTSRPRNGGPVLAESNPQAEHQRCIGSACMAWRWKRTQMPLIGPEDPTFKTEVTDGYCGMAGVPDV